MERRAEGAAIEKAATRTLRQHDVARAITAMAFIDLWWTIFEILLCLSPCQIALYVRADPVRMGPKFL